MLSTRIQYVLKAFLPWLLASIAAVLGAVLTYNAWQKSEKLHYKNVNAQFQDAANIVAKNIQTRFKTYTVIMRGVQGFYKASDEISRAEFKQYVESLSIKEKLPGVQGIGYAVILLDKDKAKHVATKHAHGFTDYRIHPAGKRPVYVPILRMEPSINNNDAVLGLDILTIPIVKQAMLASLKTNDVSITSKIILHQDRDKPNTYGFVMYLPIVKSDINPKEIYAKFKGDDEAFLTSLLPYLQGWVDVPFRMNELISGLDGEFDQGIVLKIYDGTTKHADSLVYDSSLDTEGPGQHLTRSTHTEIDPRLSASRILNIGGRDWLLDVSALKSFHAIGLTESRPVLLAVTGASLTVLLALLTFLLASRFKEVEAQFIELFNKASDGILILNKSHRFINANPAALKKLGYQSNTLIGLSFDDILSAQNHHRLDSATLLAQASADAPLELTHVTKSGDTFVAEVSINKLSNQHYFATFRDLSERIKAQQRIERLSKLYQALSETNQAIVRMHDEDALFPLVVRSAVEFGGMKMAWIGQVKSNLMLRNHHALIDGDVDQVTSVAAYGQGLNYLDKLLISVNPNIPEGVGPTGTALRTNTCVIVNDYLTATSTTPWHNEAAKFGWASAASFPIQRNGKVYAALNLYSDITYAFDDEAVALFKEMATDISFALDNFDREHQRKTFEQHLTDNEAKLSAILENITSYIYLKDTDGRYLFANKAILNLWQTNTEKLVGATDADFFDQASAFAISQTDARVFEHGEMIESEEKHLIKNTQTYKTFITTRVPLRKPDGSIYALCGISTDITERIKNEAQLQLNAQVFEASIEGILITDQDFNIQSANSSYLMMKDMDSDAIVGLSLKSTLFSDQPAEFYTSVTTVLNNISRWQGEVNGSKEDGTDYAQWVSISAIKDAQHHISHYVVIVNDISRYKAAQAKISYLSYFNNLTGLPNRQLLKERTVAAMAACQKNSTTFVLILIDLDRFKVINDSLGIAVGDIVLQKVAERLTEVLHLEDTACHQGSDEFMVLLPNTNAEQAAFLCKNLLTILSQPIAIEQKSLTVTACLGVAQFPQDGLDFESLMQSAEAAMYRAKLRGRNNIQFFAPEMHQETSMTLQIEGELREALAKNQFVLHYQPQVDAFNYEIIGFEALVRWQHPERGMVPPMQFIPIAEETGLIAEIGAWVLNEALRQQKIWQDSGLKLVPIAVNLSVIQFRQPEFYQSVVAAITQHGVSPSFLELELTESIAMEDSDFTIEILSKFHTLGVKLSIDDFGTGYSSLNYLKRFQIDKLKIDQTFVRDLSLVSTSKKTSQHENQDAAIITAIIQMAKALGFKTIAEGVETPEQLAFLQTKECDEIQGYLFSKPLSADACTPLLTAGVLAPPSAK